MNKKDNITKRQHYVQRAYLSEWANNKKTDGKIWCLFKEEKKIANPNLMGVANERFFYELKKLSQMELLFAAALCTTSNEIIAKQNPYHIIMINYQLWHLEESLFKNTGIRDDESFKDIQRQTGEKLQSLYENTVYIDKIIKGDTDFYCDEEQRIDFFFYLTMQYIRTNNMKKRQIKAFDGASKKLKDNYKQILTKVKDKIAEYKIIIDEEKLKIESENITDNFEINNIFPYILPTTVSELSYAFAIRNIMKLEILIAPEGVNFITTDQPIINILLDPDNINHEPEDVIFYVPISPQKAIFIRKGIERETCEIQIDAKRVRELNSTIFKHSLSQVYAVDKADLEPFIKS